MNSDKSNRMIEILDNHLEILRGGRMSPLGFTLDMLSQPQNAKEVTLTVEHLADCESEILRVFATCANNWDDYDNFIIAPAPKEAFRAWKTWACQYRQDRSNQKGEPHS